MLSGEPIESKDRGRKLRNMLSAAAFYSDDYSDLSETRRVRHVPEEIDGRIKRISFPGIISGRRRASFYPTIFKYLYTVGLLSPHTLASSETFIFPAISAG